MQIRCRGLQVSFGDSVALHKLDLDINAKRIVLLGQNGSGKTTLLALLAGLLRPTEGEAFINGICPYDERERSIEELSYMFGVSRFPYGIRVKDFVQFLQKSRKCESGSIQTFDHEILEHIMKKKMNELSSGETKLVEVFNAVYCTKGALILDEPFAFLDALRSAELIDRLLKSGREYIFSTHIPDEAEAVGDYFIVLDKGEVKWSGSLDDIYQDGIFEVYLNSRNPPSFDIIFRYGNIAIVKSKKESLNDSMENGQILGFRRAGIRRVYYETK